MSELIRALGALAEAPVPGHTAIARALRLPDPPPASAHADLFLFQIYPFASVYVGPEGMLGGEARDRVAGFWRALGEAPPDEPDHASTLLGLYAAVCEAERRCEDNARQVLWGQSRRALLWEHLLSWVVVYADAVERSGDAFYGPWARLLRSVLLSEACDLGAPDVLPLHLREAPALEDPRAAGGATFLTQLVAPVRSGIVLTREDLGRCASEIGAGLRTGERRFILETLLAQRAAQTLDWMRAEADRWAVRHACWDAELGVVSRFWAERARTTRDLLGELADEAKTGRGLTHAECTDPPALEDLD